MTHPLPFILAATDHGPMILNRLDYAGWGNGVGAELLEKGRYEHDEMRLLTQIVNKCRHMNGDGVVAIDAGANIGVVSVTLGNFMRGWGRVVSIEAQERIYYALCGNIALHNLFNVRAIHGALVGKYSRPPAMPEIDYTKPASFGSLEIYDGAGNKDLGQVVNSYKHVDPYHLDDLVSDRCDFIKLDIEGMELEALAAADDILNHLRPVLWIESMKNDQGPGLHELLQSRRYSIKPHGDMIMAVPMP